MKYLLDTNILSEIRKHNGNANVKTFIKNIHNEDLYISVITIGEIAAGIKKLGNKRKAAELTIWLEKELLSWFEGRILSIHTNTMIQWGELQAKANRTLPIMDSLIAAVALTYKLALVTRNTKDFADYENLTLINPCFPPSRKVRN